MCIFLTKSSVLLVSERTESGFLNSSFFLVEEQSLWKDQEGKFSLVKIFVLKLQR